MGERFFVWLVTNPMTTWWIRKVASRIDPWLFRATGGRLFSMGGGSMPMVTITTIGARSGQPRLVHLAALPHEDDWLVVASAMGQERHPAWSYNLEAHPTVEVQMPGERFLARARVLSGEEKEEVWDAVYQAIPMMRVYEQRTDRNIKVFRLTRERP